MTDETATADQGPKGSLRHRIWWLFEVLNVRLRFIFLMVLVGFVVGYWETIVNYYDRWRRPVAAADLVAAQDVEYYCPMHPNIIRAEPGNCPICGMPLVKRAKTGAAELPEGVLSRQHLTPWKVQMGRIGTSPVEYTLLSREVRTVGIIEYDETRRRNMAARTRGRIDKLLVNYVGQQVKEGDPLIWVYSPELMTAQEELLLAHKRIGWGRTPADDAIADSLIAATRQKLLLWGVTETQMDEIVGRGTVDTHLILFAPISGIVAEKNVLEGHYIQEGEDLYTIADLTNVWLQAKVFEEEVGSVAIGTAVEVASTAYPAEVFAGRITFMSYEVDPATRTVAARVEIANPDLKLKPGMYAHATIRTPVGRITEMGETDRADTTADSATAERGAPTAAFAQAYLRFATALVGDRADAEAAAALMAEAKILAETGQGSVVAASAAVRRELAAVKDKDIDALRGAMKEISIQAIGLLRARPPDGLTLYVARCPMVEADWLQTTETIANPYMGSTMPRCGVITGSIRPGGTQDHGQYVTGYFCPVAPDRLFERPEQCPIDGFPLKFVRAEKTLAVPASAVIRTGTRSIVYRESEPGTFDMIEVRLGGRAGEFYPVLSGLNAGDRVATAGAFLVDAENRLNPAAGAQFFGASSAPSPPSPPAGGHQH